MKKYDYLIGITDENQAKIKMAQYYFSIIDDALDVVVPEEKIKEKKNARDKIEEAFMWVAKSICEEKTEEVLFEKE